VPFRVIRQDFEAAHKAFKAGNFSLMNVLSNRLMSDLLFGGQKDLCLIGFFLRDAAIDLMNAQERTEVASELSEAATQLLSQIDSMLKEPFSAESAWKVYYDYFVRSVQAGRNDIEKSVYTEDPSFTHVALDQLVDMLTSQTITHSRTQIFAGVWNELSRLAGNHGIQFDDVIPACILIALNWLHPYVAVEKEEAVVSHEKSADLLDGFVQRLKHLQANRQPNGDQGAFVQTGTELLCDVLLAWRRYYIHYLDIRTAISPQEPSRKIELPIDARKKLTQSIADALRRNLPEA